MERYIIKSKRNTLDDEVLVNIRGKNIKVIKREIKVYQTEDGNFQKFVDNEMINNFILGFKLNEHIEIIKVYSSYLKKERLCFELEVDSELGYDEEYRNCVIDSLKYVTMTIEKNGAIKFYSKPDKKWFSFREGMIFKYRGDNCSFKEEFEEIKVYDITNEEELLLHDIKEDCR